MSFFFSCIVQVSINKIALLDFSLAMECVKDALINQMQEMTPAVLNVMKQVKYQIPNIQHVVSCLPFCN